MLKTADLVAEKPLSSSSDKSNVSVLVIDDDRQGRALVCRHLQMRGYDCKPVESAEQALALLETEKFAIALVDLIMPGMSGLDLLAAMRTAGYDTIPIAYSGYCEISSAIEAMKNGAMDYVQKDGDFELIDLALGRAAHEYDHNRRFREMTGIFRQWEATFNAVPELIALTDSEHRIIKLNKAMAEKIGCTPEEAEGRDCQILIQEMGISSGPCLFAHLLDDPHAEATSTTGEIFGGIYHIFVSSLKNHSGEKIGSVHVMHDITREKEAQAALERAHQETERLVSSLTSFLIEVDSDLVVRRWNSVAEETFGRPRGEILGRPMADLDLGWDLDVDRNQLLEWLGAEKPKNISNIRFRRNDGSEGIMAFTINPIIEDGASYGFFMLGKDITERIQLQNQMTQARKLESIGQLAAGIAHEINTPVQYIGDNLEFLQAAFLDLENVHKAFATLRSAAADGATDEALLGEINSLVEDIDLDFFAQQIPKAIEQSIEGVERISTIVKAMKQFSHPGVDEKTHVDLNECIRSTVTVARNEWKYVAEVEMDLDPDLPRVPCLPGEFNQVVLNIVVNAAHAIAALNEGSAAQLGWIKLSTRKDGDHAAVCISDSGTGIPAGLLDRIFDPFFTTKGVGKGTGQGLAIAHNVIVDKHGGTLTCSSETGKGATFMIRLPLAKDA